MGPRNHVSDEGPDPPTGRGTFEGDICRPTVRTPTETHLRMSALLTVRLPPRANVSVQRTRRTNAFATARDDTAMRPLAKLLWALVVVLFALYLK